MKKTLSIILVIMIAVAMLAGCGGSGGSEDPGSDGSGANGSPDALKTFGDIKAQNPVEYQETMFPEDNMLIFAFNLNGVYYRASSKLTQEMTDALWNLDYGDPDYDAKYLELLNSVKIDKLEDLTGEILSEDELAAIAGKTGQELLDEGWTVDGTYYLDEMAFWMNYGPFVYSVFFDADASSINNETFDPEEGIKGWTATGGRFEMLGNNATDIL